MVESLERHGHLDLDPGVTAKAVLSERSNDRQIAEADTRAGWEQKEAQAEEEDGWPHPGAYLLRLEGT